MEALTPVIMVDIVSTVVIPEAQKAKQVSIGLLITEGCRENNTGHQMILYLCKHKLRFQYKYSLSIEETEFWCFH